MTIDPNIQSEDPTAGVTAGSEGSDGGQGEQAQNAPAARTYTDADMAAARRSWDYQAKREREAALTAVREEYERRIAAGQSPAAAAQQAAKFDPQVQDALRSWFQENFGSSLDGLRESQIRQDINLGLTTFQSRHPELSTAQVNDILEAATQFGDAVMNATPIDRLLDMAYLQYKYGNFDEASFKKAAVDEYLKGKAKTASVPRPQGSGGSVLGQKKARDFGTADSIFEQMMKDADNI